jgi:5'-phosphate synthase pdxT subunit
VSTPLIGVLALQGDVREHVRAVESLGSHATLVRTVEELASVDGLILPGGESSTIAKLAGLFGMLEPLRAWAAEGLPMYGSCAGMILLASHLEAAAAAGQESLNAIDMTVRRNAFGRQVDSFEADLTVSGLDDGPVHAVFIRAPAATRVGPEVEVLARVHEGSSVGSIVAVRQGNALATSFHPELTGDLRIHRMFIDMVRGQR